MRTIEISTDKRWSLDLKLLLYSARHSVLFGRLARLHAPIELAIKQSETEIERVGATLDEAYAFENIHQECDQIEEFLGVGATLDEAYASEIIHQECDQIEEFLGVAFASTQVVITAFRTRIVRLSDFCREHLSMNLGLYRDKKSDDLLDCVPELRPGCDFTDIRAIYEVANYWKHRDEWKIGDEEMDGPTVRIWKPQGRQRRTINIVTKLGIEPFSTGNLRAATSAMGVERYGDLSNIRRKVDQWARGLLDRAEEQLEPELD